MSFINQKTHEIHCKIVYYGPGLSGKTKNLTYIHEKTNPEARGKLLSLATETERTLYFDFLPLALGEIRGFKTRFHLYTVPGQVFYDASRRLILNGADGIVFVVDSQPARLDANLESFDNLQTHLESYGRSLQQIPIVIQYNKRDLPSALPLSQLRGLFNPHQAPEFEAMAEQGTGVFDTLKTIVKLVLGGVRKEYGSAT